VGVRACRHFYQIWLKASSANFQRFTPECQGVFYANKNLKIKLDFLGIKQKILITVWCLSIYSFMKGDIKLSPTPFLNGYMEVFLAPTKKNGEKT